jgi:hypothetical protein
VTTKAPARPAGHAPGPADTPATGAPAESVPADELAMTPAGRAAAAAGLFSRPFGELAKGERFTTPSRTVQEGDILQFADLTGDAHP